MVWQIGIRYGNVPEVLYLYRQHSSNGSKALEGRRQWHVERPIREALDVLLGEVSDELYQSLDRLYPSDFPTWIKLSLRERIRSRNDMYRLIDAMIEKDAIDAADRDALREEVDKRIEKTMPRRWQQLIHWRRKRFGR